MASQERPPVCTEKFTLNNVKKSLIIYAVKKTYGFTCSPNTRPYLYSGTHNCPGQNLAWLGKLRLILARLIWRFDISIPPGVELPDWEEQGIWWLWDKVPTLGIY
jgi:hypothetical protein